MRQAGVFFIMFCCDSLSWNRGTVWQFAVILGGYSFQSKLVLEKNGERGLEIVSLSGSLLSLNRMMRKRMHEDNDEDDNEEEEEEKEELSC